MFNDLNWGGYLAFHLWPGQKIFADSMADVTGEMTLQYETALTLSAGWEDIFAKYQIEWVILPAIAPSASELQDIGWKVLYKDETAIVLRKK